VENMPPKRESLSVATKIAILKDIDNKIKYEDIKDKYGLKHISNVSEIKRKRKDIEEGFKQGMRLTNKSLKKGLFQEVDKKVMSFVNEMTDKGVNVTLQAMEVKAKEIIEQEGIVGLKGTRGYLERVMQRNNVAVQVKHGDASSVSQATVTDWKVRLDTLIKDYDSKDIFNIDECGIFYCLLPSKTLAVKGKKLLNGKASKVRLTLLVGANMTGTEKLPMLVIGKSAKPRCFKSKTPPLMYEANKKAWMTGSLFETYMKKLDRKFSLQGRKVIIFADNCSAHPPSLQETLGHIQLEFLPKNTTSVVQPMDQGVIHSLKSKYRVKLLTHIIKEVEGKEKTASDVKIDVLMAMNWVKFAWDSVTKDTIANCFREALFVKDAADLGDVDVIQIEENILPDLLTALGETVDADEYVSADDALNAVDPNPEEEEDDDETEIDEGVANEEGEEAEGIQEPSMEEAAKAMDVLTRKFYHSNFVSQIQFDQFERSFLNMRISSMKQTKMTDFFQKK
jgi:DDE superfamily endonuclease